MTVKPAMGRDYKTKAEALVDWNGNKDFIICDPGHPTYINKADAEKYNAGQITIRFNKLTKFVLV